MDPLIGKTVKSIRKMTKTEAEFHGWELGFDSGSTVIVFSDGTKLFASRDPEGNGPGSFFGVGSDGKEFQFP